MKYIFDVFSLNCQSRPSYLQRWWWTIETWISCKQIGHKQFSFSNYRKCELDEIRESQILLNFLSWARNGYQAAWHLTILLQNRHLEWTPSSCCKISGVKNISLRNMWSRTDYPHLKCCPLHQIISSRLCQDDLRRALCNRISTLQCINKLELMNSWSAKSTQVQKT